MCVQLLPLKFLMSLPLYVACVPGPLFFSCLWLWVPRVGVPAGSIGIGSFIMQVPDYSFTILFFFLFQSRFITLCVFMPVAFQVKIAIVIYFRGSGRWALPDTAYEQSAEAVSQ